MKFPVIFNGAGVVLVDGIDASAKLAEKLDAPVCCNYQHNDAFPGSHPFSMGPLGYNGSKAAMEINAKADVVLALGTRLNPFSTLPGYGIDYWPKDAKLIQMDINADREERRALIDQTKKRWSQELVSMEHEDDDPGTNWNERAREREPKKMSPRNAWLAIRHALPEDAIISTGQTGSGYGCCDSHWYHCPVSFRALA